MKKINDLFKIVDLF